MVERVEYDEFGLFHENAEEFGLPYDGPPAVRRESVEVEPGRRMSALVWGEAPPELVLVHGGAQNAHTWDTVAMALGRPLVAVDLPGHGHSDAASHEGAGAFDTRRLAADVATALRVLAPEPRGVVGMSLGGLTTIALTDVAPELVRKAVLVDVTPGVDRERARHITDFVNGPATFPSFDEILARTIEYNPTRSVSSLRRGILHNAVQLEDGSWVWRHARHRHETEGGPDRRAAPGGDNAPMFTELWDVLSAITVPLMLVRGMLPQSVVGDDDEAELVRRLPSARIEHVQNAGHSVQGDAPLELARLIEDFVFAG
ncbi:MAG TPA: alpha/beta hydrolase [Acidimicrobiales bacterium]|nr:alpha/beta hydrolase [Acidimicrobiales bacterium]